MNAWIMSIDPKVLEFWKAVITVIVALIAALIAASLQYRQWKTAHDKLKLDLFERRIKVFETIRAELLAPAVGGRYPDKVSDACSAAIADARWIFGPEVTDFLTTLRSKLHTIPGVEEEFRIGPPLSASENQRFLTILQMARWDLAERVEQLMAPYLRIGR